jgi:hypothetical protein
MPKLIIKVRCADCETDLTSTSRIIADEDGGATVEVPVCKGCADDHYDNGYQSGYDEGYEEGFENGRKEGLEEAGEKGD